MFGIRNKTKNNQLSTTSQLSRAAQLDTRLKQSMSLVSEKNSQSKHLSVGISDEIYAAKTNTRAKNILRVQAMLKVAMACGLFAGAIGGTSSAARRSTKLSKRKVIDASNIANHAGDLGKTSIHSSMHQSNHGAAESLNDVKSSSHSNSSSMSQGVVFNKIHSAKALMNLRKNIDYTNTPTGLYFVSENGDLNALDILTAGFRVESISPVFVMILQKDGITYVQVYEQLDAKKPIIITTNRAKQRYDVDLTTARLAERSMLYSRNVKDIKQKKLF